jgi:hypothetical protein
MTEGQSPDSRQEETSNERQRIGDAIGWLAAAAAFAVTIITLIEGGEVALFLIIFGIAVGVAGASYQISRSRRYRRAAARWGGIAVIVASVVLVLTGIILTNKTSSAPPSCQKPARVSGADTPATHFLVTVELPCTVPPDHLLFLVVQLLNVGRKGTVTHSEYYLAWDVKNVAGRQSFAASPPSCETRRYYLISVTQDALALMQQSPQIEAKGFYGEPIDTVIGKYITSNVQIHQPCHR